MKILMVNKFLYPNGGSETYIFELGKCLSQMGHEVQFFGMDHEGRIVGNKLNVYTSDMDFHSCGVLKKLSYPFKIIYSKEAFQKINELLYDFKPDVVHLNNINFQLTPSIIEAIADYDLINHTNTKIVATAHDYQWVCPNHMMKKPLSGEVCFDCENGKYHNCVRNKCIHGSFFRSILGYVEATFYKLRNTYGIVDTVICPSKFIKNKLETNPEIKGKCVVLHNFLVTDDNSENTNDFVLQNINKGMLPSKYVLYFGRYAEEKGVKTLIKVCKNLPDINFVFAGSGVLSDEVDSVDNIINLGFLNSSDMHEVIKNAEFVVFPSEWYENCPFSVMETQQFGIPIIASDMGGTSELIYEGMTGELFEAGNSSQLISLINRFWNDEDVLKKYKEGCKKYQFDDVNTYCKKIIDIYKA